MILGRLLDFPESPDGILSLLIVEWKGALQRSESLPHYFYLDDPSLTGGLCSAVKNLPASAEDMGSIPGLGRSPGGGNGNPLQYSCLENSTDREA